MDIKNSKSIFAKLLAQEDIQVQHTKVPTASFDTKNRVLTLPIWKDMTGDLYDLLCGHEVGHALYTPAAGWHSAIMGEETDIAKANHVLKGYLNILEDARIEKKIKSKYPGLRANFYRAYQGLHEKDFFEVKGKPLGELMLIDRINLHFKLGSFVAVPFSGEERGIVQRVENLETWEQVEALARELLERAKKELEEQKQEISQRRRIRVGAGSMFENDDDEEYEFREGDEFEFDLDSILEEDLAGLTDAEKEIMERKSVASETDRAFRKNEDDLLDVNSRPYEYIDLPDIDSRPFIVNYRQVMAQMVFLPEQEIFRADTYAAYRKKNDKVVNYLVKEFELRRNAEQLSRAKVSKSGEIDVKKVFGYRYNEDLFRRITTVPNGKNHGLIMFFDMSGSMTTQMSQTIEQMLVLVEFCRKVNIPFEVYGFSNSNNHPDPYYRYLDNFAQRVKLKVGDIDLSDTSFNLRQYFSDTMRPTEYKQQIGNLTLLARIWKKRANRWGLYKNNNDNIDMKIPDSEELNGTPLNQTIMLSLDIFRRFKERTKADVVNMAVLTDGDTDSQLHHVVEYNGKRYSHCIRDVHRTNVIITHQATRRSVKIAESDKYGTNALVKLVRDITGVNLVCFDIVSRQSRGVIQNKMFRSDRLTPEQYTLTETLAKKFRKERVLVLENLGFNEYYLIPGGDDLEIDDDEIEVENGADKKKIMRAFAEMQSNKTTSRILLNRFVKMIA